MIDAGVFPDHVRVELLGGLLIQNPDKRCYRPRRNGPADLTNGPIMGPMTKNGSHNYSTLALERFSFDRSS